MKKIFALILAVVMGLSLCACGNDATKEESKEQVLTTVNIGNYLSIKGKVMESVFEEGLVSKLSEGNSKIEIGSVNKSGATFKNVTVTCQVWVEGGMWCGWEFEKDNIRCEEEHMETYNYKEITLDIASDGTATVSEKLQWRTYEDEMDKGFAVGGKMEDADIEIKIISVSGTVVEN